MHVLAMFHAATGLLLQVATAPLRTHAVFNGYSFGDCRHKFDQYKCQCWNK